MIVPAREYHRRKNFYLVASILVQTLFLSVFAVLSVHGHWPQTFGRLGYFSLFFALWQAVLWPIRTRSGWRLEKDFGLLKQSFGGWLADTFKAQLLSFVLFLAGAFIFYGTVRTWPSQWWWVLAALTFGFSTFFSTLFPVWVLPLFYRSTPLKDPALIAHLEETLQHCGFPKLPLFELRLGEKTSRANAMLTGFGRTRRALLSDTLLSGYTTPQIQMVLAHEAGHHALAHLWRTLALEATVAAAGFFALYRASDALAALFGVENLLDLRLFPALVLLSYLAGIALLPAKNAVSRFHEKEADRYALRRYPNPETFRTLMEKLADQNLANPTPGKWEEFLLYTHPSKQKRLEAAEKFVRMFLANSPRAH